MCVCVLWRGIDSMCCMHVLYCMYVLCTGIFFFFCVCVCVCVGICRGMCVCE